MESPLTVSEIPDWLKKAYELRINDVKKSFLLTEQALQVSQENKNESFTAQSLCQLSLLNMIIGDYETCQVQAEKAIDIFKKQGDEKGVADAKYNLAGIYYKTDKFHLGLTYLLDCQSIYKKLGDHHNMSRTLKSMGTIYEYFGDENSAIRSYGDAIDAAIQAHDPNLESNAYNPLSGIHLNNGDQKKARDLIEKAIAIKQKSGDLRGLAFSLYGRGKVNTKSGNFLEAEKDFTEAIKIHQDMNEHLGIGMCYYKLGELYFDMGENKNAIKTLKAAQKISVKFNNALITFKSNRLLYLIYKKENKTKKALFFLEKYLNEKENVTNSRTFDVIKSYEAITRVQSLEQEAQTQKEKLDIIEKKNQELDSFFYQVSHDLKGPISSLIGLNFLAREELSDPQALDYLAHMNDQVRRMNTIIDELIKITKVNHLDDNKTAIDFDKIITACIESFRYLPNFNNISFSHTIQPGIHFKAEWILINTILQNLIENAIKYARMDQENPFIHIQVSQDTNQIKLVITDNGIGMDKESRDNVFNMFYRASDSIEGIGLGMYILSRAIDRLNGKVCLESTPGQGSEFTILFPQNAE